MKYLFLFLFTIQVSHSETIESMRSKIDKDVLQNIELLEKRQRVGECHKACKDRGYSYSLERECMNKINERAESEYQQPSETLLSIDNSKINMVITIADTIYDIKCLEFFRQKLEALNIPYQTGDNCDALKLLVPKQ